MAKKLISPRGVAIYPRLNKPDTKYVPEGVYHVKLKMDTDLPEIAAFIKQIDDWHNESVEAAVAQLMEEGKCKTEAAARKKVKDGDKPYQYIEDEDGEDTNFVKVNFKMKAKVISKKDGKEYELNPDFFDAKNATIDANKVPAIYSGSELRIAFVPKLWFTLKLGASVKLQLEAAKILKLVSGSGGDADSYGFGDDEGDFEASSATPFSDDEEGGSDDDSSGSDSGDF